MSEIALVRHGEANARARSDADQDKRPDHGRRRSLWRGEPPSGAGRFDRAI
ncbi:MAG: hypothetical protein H6895_01535 [Defluviimonas sp.]|uniref:hypothetical protein n=1 Tax=Albidovulum sp. TaxID=1872424 RepID=UPI002A303DAB|nr:hypothetical protein [Defluviimonas sp.]